MAADSVFGPRLDHVIQGIVAGAREVLPAGARFSIVVVLPDATVGGGDFVSMSGTLSPPIAVKLIIALMEQNAEAVLAHGARVH